MLPNPLSPSQPLEGGSGLHPAPRSVVLGVLATRRSAATRRISLKFAPWFADTVFDDTNCESHAISTSVYPHQSTRQPSMINIYNINATNHGTTLQKQPSYAPADFGPRAVPRRTCCRRFSREGLASYQNQGHQPWGGGSLGRSSNAARRARSALTTCVIVGRSRGSCAQHD